VRGPGAEQVRILFHDRRQQVRRSGGKRCAASTKDSAVRGVLKRRERPRTAAEPDVRDRVAATRGRATSRIQVMQPPSARVDEVQYVFPSLHAPRRPARPGRQYRRWEGALVTLGATANMPVQVGDGRC